MPRAFPLFSLLLLVLFTLQYLFVELPGRIGVLFLAAFHPVNAVVMFWIAIHVARRAMTYVNANKKSA